MEIRKEYGVTYSSEVVSISRMVKRILTLDFGIVFVLYLKDFPGTRNAFTYGFNSVSLGRPSIRNLLA